MVGDKVGEMYQLSSAIYYTYLVSWNGSHLATVLQCGLGLAEWFFCEPCLGLQSASGSTGAAGLRWSYSHI